jgi:HSP20 family molecular chaperone IbpA
LKEEETLMSTFANGRESGATPASYAHRRVVEPPVDVLESADQVLVVADIPGASAETLDVRIENDTLTLEAKRAPAPEDAAPALTREYEEVDFARTFRIPAGIDAANITAEAKNGTIVVRLPKAAAAKTRKIEVRAT